MILYPLTLAGAGSHETRKRVYHSSDTRRLRGAISPTMGKTQNNQTENANCEELGEEAVLEKSES